MASEEHNAITLAFYVVMTSIVVVVVVLVLWFWLGRSLLKSRLPAEQTAMYAELEGLCRRMDSLQKEDME